MFFPGVERPGREVNLSPQSSAEAKNEVYFLLPPFVPSRHGQGKLYLLHILEGIYLRLLGPLSEGSRTADYV